MFPGRERTFLYVMIYDSPSAACPLWKACFQEVIFFEFIAVDWKTGLRRLKNRSTENEKSFGAD